MSAEPQNIDNIDALKAERRVLKIIVFCMIIFLFLQVGSLLRLFGVPGIPPILLISYRFLDMVVVGSFFVFCGTKLVYRWEDLIFLLMILYPLPVGIMKGNLSITFFNDVAIFYLFLLKVMVFRTLLIRFRKHVRFDTVFKKFALRIIARSILVAVLILLLAFVASRSGITWYYQAPAELTFAASLAAASGLWPSYFALFILSLLGGKRGIMVGILAIGFFATFSRSQLKKFAKWGIISVFVIVPPLYLFGSSIQSSEAAAIQRLQATVELASIAIEQSSNWEQMLMLVDAGRFVEWISVKPHIDGLARWIGNGYGFRYELDNAFLRELGRAPAKYDVSNSHFTPLAVVVKFGLIGLGVWTFWSLRILFHGHDRKSYFQFACKLGFISMLLQSMFSYAFFVSFFSPIFVAGATTKPSREPRPMPSSNNTKI